MSDSFKMANMSSEQDDVGMDDEDGKSGEKVAKKTGTIRPGGIVGYLIVSLTSVVIGAVLATVAIKLDRQSELVGPQQCPEVKVTPLEIQCPQYPSMTFNDTKPSLGA